MKGRGTMRSEENRPAEGGRKPLLVGLLTLALIGGIAGGWLWLHPGDKAAPTSAANALTTEAGFVRLGEAAKAHPDYNTLLRLRMEREELAVKLAREERRLLAMTAPDAIKKPFDDAVEQKKKQVLLQEHREFLEKLAEAEKAKREETRALYEAARDEINAAYFNEIFNTQLKLDNADIMRLSADTIADLKRHLENLQRERGRHQFDLHQKYEAEIRAYKESLAAEHGISLAALEASTDERLRAEEMRKRSEAQVRNLNALQKNMLDATELRIRIQESRSALRAKEREISALEGGLTADLASKAAKLAALHHLSVIYAAPVADAFPSADNPFAGLQVIGGTALDLTDELTQEITSSAKKQTNISK